MRSSSSASLLLLTSHVRASTCVRTDTTFAAPPPPLPPHVCRHRWGALPVQPQPQPQPALPPGMLFTSPVASAPTSAPYVAPGGLLTASAPLFAPAALAPLTGTLGSQVARQQAVQGFMQGQLASMGGPAASGHAAGGGGSGGSGLPPEEMPVALKLKEGRAEKQRKLEVRAAALLPRCFVHGLPHCVLAASMCMSLSRPVAVLLTRMPLRLLPACCLLLQELLRRKQEQQEGDDAPFSVLAGGDGAAGAAGDPQALKVCRCSFS